MTRRKLTPEAIARELVIEVRKTIDAEAAKKMRGTFERELAARIRKYGDQRAAGGG